RAPREYRGIGGRRAHELRNLLGRGGERRDGRQLELLLREPRLEEAEPCDPGRVPPERGHRALRLLETAGGLDRLLLEGGDAGGERAAALVERLALADTRREPLRAVGRAEADLLELGGNLGRGL